MVNIAIFINCLILYIAPGVLALSALIRLLTTKDRNRKLKAGIQLAMVFSFWGCLVFYHYDGENKAEQAQLGTYYLTNYPECHPCELELQEHIFFVVKQLQDIKETGNWHFESGQDYWITYLNKYDQLGSGKYSYQQYRLKYKRR